MAAPTYSKGTLGNGINAVSLAAGKTIACLIDGSTILAWAALCKLLTGASAITAAVNFNLYRVSGADAGGTTTLSSSPTAGATSFTVTSATGIGKNCLIGVIPAAGGVGEIVTVSNVSGSTITCSALTNSYSSSDLVFLLEQSASVAIAPGISWAANTEYSKSIRNPDNMVYLLGVTNSDSTNAATITVTVDKNPAFT